MLTGFRFGKLPPRTDYRTLQFGSYLKDDIPAPPPSVDLEGRVCANLNEESSLLFPIFSNDILGNCLGPETKVLTEKLEWIPIKNIKIGDKLIGFDEKPQEKGHRRFCITIVENVKPLLKQCYDLKFSDGTKVRASYDHMWLRQRRGKDCWLKTESMILNKGKKRSAVAKCFDVWESIPKNEYDTGYLSAALDGEGCLSIDYQTNHLKSIHFSQRPNEMLVEVERILTELGFRFSHNQITNSSLSNNGYDILVLQGGRRAACKLLGSVRPKRLIVKFDGNNLGSIRSDKITLIEKKNVGEQTVIALQTSSRTFIAEGIASHNCTIAGAAHGITVYHGMVSQRHIPALSEVIRIYNHLTGGIDSGLYMLDVVKYWRSTGIEDSKIYAYASVNKSNHTHVKQAIQLFGGLFMGFQCQEKVLEEFRDKKPWKPGHLINAGHAVYVVGYDEEGVEVLTWGSTQRGTWDWWDMCVDESYALLPPEAKLTGFTPGFDFARLQKDLAEVAVI